MIQYLAIVLSRIPIFHQHEYKPFPEIASILQVEAIFDGSVWYVGCDLDRTPIRTKIANATNINPHFCGLVGCTDRLQYSWMSSTKNIEKTIPPTGGEHPKLWLRYSFTNKFDTNWHGNKWHCFYHPNWLDTLFISINRKKALKTPAWDSCFRK